MKPCYPMTKAKREVHSCIETWSDIFENKFPGKIEYAYAKGSSIKKWDSPIDYVPVLSDMDIHIKIREDNSLFNDPRKALADALETSEEYEKEFLRRNPGALHVPRTQIVVLNDNLADPDFFLPSDTEDIFKMFGEPELDIEPPDERIRSIDLKALHELEDVLRSLPLSALDRTGLDHWTLIRRLTWRVSPTPMRLLTQVEEEPEQVWRWNRTTACRMLEKNGLTDVSESYQGYYMSGWKMFLTEFKDSEVMRQTLYRVHQVMELSINHAKLKLM